MTYKIVETTKFKKDLKLCLKMGLNIKKFEEVVTLLKNGEPLPFKYFDHPLKPSKNYVNCRELHIEPDWLLVYRYNNEELILHLLRTGTHSNLFK